MADQDQTSSEPPVSQSENSSPDEGRREVLREIPIATIEREFARVLAELAGTEIAFRVRVGSVRYHDWYHTDGMQMEVEISEVQAVEEGDDEDLEMEHFVEGPDIPF